MCNDLERVALDPMESKRTYNFANGDKVSYDNVVAIFKNTGETSRIETLYKGKTRIHIIKGNWISIDIEAMSFTV